MSPNQEASKESRKFLDSENSGRAYNKCPNQMNGKRKYARVKINLNPWQCQKIELLTIC